MRMRAIAPVLALVLVGLSPLAAADDSGDGRDGGHGMRMKAMDTDGSGTVSREEFTAQMQKRFDQMDRDDDGELTAEEIRLAKRRHHERRQERSDD